MPGQVAGTVHCLPWGLVEDTKELLERAEEEVVTRSSSRHLAGGFRRCLPAQGRPHLLRE